MNAWFIELGPTSVSNWEVLNDGSVGIHIIHISIHIHIYY